MFDMEKKKTRKRYLGLLIPSIVLYVIGLVGIGLGAYFVNVPNSPQEISSFGEALGTAFALMFVVIFGSCLLALGIVCIIIGIPLFFGGIALKNKDKKELENKTHNESV